MSAMNEKKAKRSINPTVKNNIFFNKSVMIYFVMIDIFRKVKLRGYLFSLLKIRKPARVTIITGIRNKEKSRLIKPLIINAWQIPKK